MRPYPRRASRLDRPHTYHKKQSEIYKPNPKSVEIIGATDLAFGYNAHDGSYAYRHDLTQTIVDFTTHATQARILLTNSTGAARYLTEAIIVGKRIERFSGEEGWIHDSFVDEDSIYYNGEIKLEVGNNMLVTLAQGNQLADYLWKKSRAKRHEYILLVSGTRLWYMPGEHYTLQIGGVGEREYIDSLVECTSNKWERRATDIGHTVLRFEEVLESWKYDSNATARFISRGSPGRNSVGDEIIVAASTYCGGKRDITCDGTADDEDIQAAIDYLAGRGGGVVRITEGTFYTAAKLAMRNNVQLLGRGPISIIEKNFDDYAIEAAGTSDVYISNFGIGNLKITQASGDTNENYLIYLYYSKDFLLDAIWFVDYRKGAVYAPYNIGGTIKSCIIDNANLAPSTGIYGIIAKGDGIIILDNTIQNLTSSTGLVLGVLIQTGSTKGCIVANNVIRNLKGVAPLVRLGAIGLEGKGTTCQGNMIDNIQSIGYSSGVIDRACGIYCSGDKNQIISNRISDAEQYGIEIVNTAEDTVVSTNIAYDNGNLIDHYTCETVNAPHLTGDGAFDVRCTFDRSAVRAYLGSYSFRQTVTNEVGWSTHYFTDNNDNDDMHGLVAGLTYDFSGYCYVPSTGGPLPSEVYMAINYYDSGAWTPVSTVATQTDAWEKLSLQFTLPATATGVYIDITISEASSLNEYVDWDHFRLYPVGVDNTHLLNYADAGTNTMLDKSSWA